MVCSVFVFTMANEESLITAVSTLTGCGFSATAGLFFAKTNGKCKRKITIEDKNTYTFFKPALLMQKQFRNLIKRRYCTDSMLFMLKNEYRRMAKIFKSIPTFTTIYANDCGKMSVWIEFE